MEPETGRRSFPVEIVTSVTHRVQWVFTVLAEEIAHRIPVVRRRRKFSAATLAQTLVFGFLHKPRSSVEDLAQTAGACGVAVTPQAVEQRFTPALAEFLRQLLSALVAEVVAAPKVAIPLLQRFTAVFVQDSSAIALPDEYAEQWPGCGGNASKAGLKVQTRLDLLTGELAAVQLEAGREPDQSTSLQRTGWLPGSLRLCDLGYFCLGVLTELTQNNVYWISRLPSTTVVFDAAGKSLDLLAWLSQYVTGCEPVEIGVQLGRDYRLPCRLLVARAPQEVANRRRQRLYRDAQRKGRTPSAERVAWCGWTIFVTNVEPERLNWREVLVLYRARWQIELLFKLWKSHGLIAAVTSSKPHRRAAEFFARLMAVIVQHWLLLTSVWLHPNRSLTKASRAIRAIGRTLAALISHRETFQEIIENLVATLAKTARINSRRRKPSTYQLLGNPDLLDYALT
jgi:hypothetical protein